MCGKSEHESILAVSLPRGALVALGLLVLLFAFAFDAAAQKSTGSTTTADQTNVEQDTTLSFTQYVPLGYSLEGPLRVVSATTEAIKFYSGREKKPLVLKLEGTAVTVKDSNNKALSLSSLVNGVTVYVCRSADKKTVLVFIVPSTGKENRNDI